MKNSAKKVSFADREVTLPPGHGHLFQPLKKFARDNQQHDRNVFLMMPFEESRHNQAIARAIKGALLDYGLIGHRADDRDYAPTLWDNVCTYVLGCRYGIAVFEKTKREAFNPNVAIELGFSLSRGKKVLLLKDSRIPSLPTDIVGRLYRQFDPERLGKSIRRQVAAWAHGLGIKKRPSVPPVLLTLTPREEKVIRMNFGIGEKRSHSIEEIAAAFEVSPRLIEGIRAKALRKLRHPERISAMLKDWGESEHSASQLQYKFFA